MCFSTDKNENAIYILCTVLLTVSVFLLPFGKTNFSAIVCCVSVLLILITLTITDNKADKATDVVIVDTKDDAGAGVKASAKPPLSRACTTPYAPTRAEVPGNVVVRPRPAVEMREPQNPNQQFGKGLKLLLPVEMETGTPVTDGCDNAPDGCDNAPQCGQGFEIIPVAESSSEKKFKIVPNMPPFPGVVQYTGDTIWRLPEWPADQPSREESIAAVVSDLPTCTQQNPKDMIRNQGLYGIKGNVACDLLKRSAVADTGFLQPLGARNAFLAYNSYDQLHAKDQFLIPNQKQVF